MGSSDGIMGAIGVVAVAIENNQRHWARGTRSIHKNLVKIGKPSDANIRGRDGRTLGAS